MSTGESLLWINAKKIKRKAHRPRHLRCTSSISHIWYLLRFRWHKLNATCRRDNILKLFVYCKYWITVLILYFSILFLPLILSNSEFICWTDWLSIVARREQRPASERVVSWLVTWLVRTHRLADVSGSSVHTRWKRRQVNRWGNVVTLDAYRDDENTIGNC